MSTKIFNGFIINREVSTYELNEMMNIIRKEVNNTYLEIIYKDFIRFTAKMLDNKYCMNKRKYNTFLNKELKVKENEIIYKVFTNKVKESILSEEIYNSDYDYSCSMTIHPLKDKTLLLLFSQRNEYNKLFREWDKEEKIYTKNKFDFIDEYNYYNNTDRPNNISEKDWELREKDWNNAIGYNAPSERGMIAEFINNKEIPSKIFLKDLKQGIECIYEYRIERVSKKYVNEKYNRKIEKILGDEMDVGSYIELYNKMIKDPQYKKDIKKAEKKFRKILPLSYSIGAFDRLNEVKPILKEEV